MKKPKPCPQPCYEEPICVAKERTGSVHLHELSVDDTRSQSSNPSSSRITPALAIVLGAVGFALATVIAVFIIYSRRRMYTAQSESDPIINANMI
jgi:hypothetical protein